jgi:hypothetical protein
MHAHQKNIENHAHNSIRADCLHANWLWEICAARPTERLMWPRRQYLQYMQIALTKRAPRKYTEKAHLLCFHAAVKNTHTHQVYEEEMMAKRL